MINRDDFNEMNDDTIDIPDFVEDKTATESSVDMSIFKMSDDELYDDDDNDDQTDYDDIDETKPKKRRRNNSSSLVICLILIVILLLTTVGTLIYGIRQHNAYVKVNTENVQLKANEDALKKQIVEKDTLIASLNQQIANNGNNNSSNSGSDSSNKNGTEYIITDGPLTFRTTPTSDAAATTYNDKSKANNGETYMVIEIVNDRDLGDQVKWAKLADDVYFMVDDNGNVYAKKN